MEHPPPFLPNTRLLKLALKFSLLHQGEPQPPAKQNQETKDRVLNQSRNSNINSCNTTRRGFDRVSIPTCSTSRPCPPSHSATSYSAATALVSVVDSHLDDDRIGGDYCDGHLVVDTGLLDDDEEEEEEEEVVVVVEDNDDVDSDSDSEEEDDNDDDGDEEDTENAALMEVRLYDHGDHDDRSVASCTLAWRV